MTSVKERVGNSPAAHAMTDLLRRSVETFIDMQEQFLKIAGKQTHTWVDASQGRQAAYQPEQLVGLAREGMENFVKAQKQFLDVIAEENRRRQPARNTPTALGRRRSKPSCQNWLGRPPSHSLKRKSGWLTSPGDR